MGYLAISPKRKDGNCADIQKQSVAIDNMNHLRYITIMNENRNKKFS